MSNSMQMLHSISMVQLPRMQRCTVCAATLLTGKEASSCILSPVCNTQDLSSSHKTAASDQHDSLANHELSLTQLLCCKSAITDQMHKQQLNISIALKHTVAYGLKLCLLCRGSCLAPRMASDALMPPASRLTQRGAKNSLSAIAVCKYEIGSALHKLMCEKMTTLCMINSVIASYQHVVAKHNPA